MHPKRNTLRLLLIGLSLAFLGSSVAPQEFILNSYRFAAGGGPSPPYTVDFTSGFSYAVLDGQNGWVDEGDGNDFTVAANGVYNSEGGWSNYKAARYNGGTLDADMQAYGIWYSQGEDGSGMGVAVRMNSDGSDFYSATYTDDDEYVRLYKTVSGTSSQLTFWDKSGTPLADGDTIRVAVSNDTLYVWYDGTILDATGEYDASITTGSYAGLACYGGSNQYIKEWGATNWP